jgi:hypothetical protein
VPSCSSRSPSERSVSLRRRMRFCKSSASLLLRKHLGNSHL